MEQNVSMEFALANATLVEEMYERYLTNPQSVEPKWRQWFESDLTPYSPQIQSSSDLSLRVYHLINAYRTYGHLLAKFDPIATHEPVPVNELELERYGLSEADLNQVVPAFGLHGKERATLQEVIDILRQIYCGTVGFEYMNLQSPELEEWIQKKIESNGFQIEISPQEKTMILQQLNRSELLETFLHTKYVGQKRFSVEGSETLIPILESVIEQAAKQGLEELIIGMAHRGRLNVLSNILKKSYSQIFNEFESAYIPDTFEGTGDVKYHKGFQSDVTLPDGKRVKITLAPNPSHLESVDAVVEGQTFAKQKIKGDFNKKRTIPVLVHGDAALAGQGVVYEVLQFQDLAGYSTGGTVHLVINNQIGFTTIPQDSRSTYYCTDIAKTFGAPVFHVNAEDPEKCWFIAKMAVEIRQLFHCDIFIDINCYRKYGHNESDEPAYTQPLEYQLIKKKMTIREIYRDQLIKQGVLEKAIAEKLEAEFKQALQEALSQTQTVLKEAPKDNYVSSLKREEVESIQTGVNRALLIDLAKKMSEVPKGFSIHPKLSHLVQERLQAVLNDPNKPALDWGTAENLAYASLLWQGIDVRLSGQDSCRGTFSHRHAMWVDQKENRTYFPLKHLKETQGSFDVFNSPLSEYAVLGFEYGYSIGHPEALTIWEAQFGDFSNGAQIVIDQYLSTSEQKWNLKSGLVLLLPHGYEGQGPEHSSGRIERFLTLAGHDNLQIVNPTTPAQFFHLLRRQALQKIKKPLVVFTPKGLLRHPLCLSSLNELESGMFQDVLVDPHSSKEVDRILFCSGRVYYDLIQHYDPAKEAILRIEQLYPLNVERLKEWVMQRPNAKEFIWVQEEPENMGAWLFIQDQIHKCFPDIELHYIGRKRSSSPATGSYLRHNQELKQLISELFDTQSSKAKV